MLDGNPNSASNHMNIYNKNRQNTIEKKMFFLVSGSILSYGLTGDFLFVIPSNNTNQIIINLNGKDLLE